MSRNDRTSTDAPTDQKPDGTGTPAIGFDAEARLRGNLDDTHIEAHPIEGSVSDKLLVQDRERVTAWIRGDSMEVKP